MTRVPETLRNYVVPAHLLSETRDLLAEPGAEQMEAVVVWIGTIENDTRAQIVAAVRPGQIAYRSGAGCAVEVPQDALTELISVLPTGHVVLVRLHTHPGEAYHSEVDDTNMLIAHRGAISIVVPDFARRPLDLNACSINELHPYGRWVELSQRDVADRFEVR